MTKRITTTKKRKNLILSTKTKQVRIFFRIIFPTETFKKNLKINNDREKKNEKQRGKKDYKAVRKNIITTVKRILSKFEMFIKTSKTEMTSRNKTLN